MQNIEMTAHDLTIAKYLLKRSRNILGKGSAERSIVDGILTRMDEALDREIRQNSAIYSVANENNSPSENSELSGSASAPPKSNSSSEARGSRGSRTTTS